MRKRDFLNYQEKKQQQQQQQKVHITFSSRSTYALVRAFIPAGLYKSRC